MTYTDLRLYISMKPTKIFRNQYRHSLWETFFIFIWPDVNLFFFYSIVFFLISFSNNLYTAVIYIFIIYNSSQPLKSQVYRIELYRSFRRPTIQAEISSHSISTASPTFISLNLANYINNKRPKYGYNYFSIQLIDPCSCYYSYLFPLSRQINP